MPLAPARMARAMAFFMARRWEMRFSSCWAMFSATSWAFMSGLRTSTMFRRTFLPTSFSTARRYCSICSPPLPMTMPGRAQCRKTVTTSPLRSISILGTPAPYRVFLRYLRIFWSSTIRSPTFSSLAYQRESQSLMTPTRRPWGLTFCPINGSPPSYAFSATARVT